MRHKVLVILDEKAEVKIRVLAGESGESLSAVASNIVRWFLSGYLVPKKQAEDMQSCCTCGRLHNGCEVFPDGMLPEHNLNDSPCEEWVLG